ncbi:MULTISPECIES: SH3 domain-containing protein [Nostocales]|uniref:SH3 domain-containing protein n=3 Tax=Nostocales TaxID=1161 RepID=A0A0C1R4B5_9CYAN|nr:SH3 domain-containing protein [Tolypothrix bouteillei]KAF3890278.1 SH3 domain-containing protein [Tolypothrix bouteillei VB521301]
MLVKQVSVFLMLIVSSAAGYALIQSPVSAESKFCQYWEVTATSVNVRENNRINSKIIDTLPKGTVVELHGWSQDGEWADISTQQYQGWVYANYLKCYKK